MRAKISAGFRYRRRTGFAAFAGHYQQGRASQQQLRYRTMLTCESAHRLPRPFERERNTFWGASPNGCGTTAARTNFRLARHAPTRRWRRPRSSSGTFGQSEIQARLRDLEVSGDLLDATRIYLERNWARAVDLLDELRGRARAEMRSLIDLLLEARDCYWMPIFSLCRKRFHGVPLR